MEREEGLWKVREANMERGQSGKGKLYKVKWRLKWRGGRLKWRRREAKVEGEGG